MSSSHSQLTFWGVRGSTPTVDPATRRFGGNTPCVELVTPGGTQFILDCGTGLRMLGNAWTGARAASGEAHIFVTHYHWDHIQGIPFFSPFYSEKNHFHFYSFRSKFLGRNSLKQVFEAQMALPYFPVDVSAMPAKRKFTELSDGDSLSVGETKICARLLNHPQGCLGFRFDTAGGTVVYATDNEPGDARLDQSLRELAAGADVFIHDAQYTSEQLAGPRKGWGHSSWLEGVKIAREAGVRTLVLFHHDPDSSDRFVDSLLNQARDQFDSVYAATEGMVMTLGGEHVQVHLPGSRPGTRGEAQFRAIVAGTTEGGQAFQEETAVRDLSLQGALIYLDHRPRLQSELKVTMEAPGLNGAGAMRLRGYVVRIEPGTRQGQSAVGVVFTE